MSIRDQDGAWTETYTLVSGAPGSLGPPSSVAWASSSSLAKPYVSGVGLPNCLYGYVSPVMSYAWSDARHGA